MNVNPKKKKIHFNLVDLILIIIALASVSVLVFVFSSKSIAKTSSSQTVEIEYTITFSPVREEYINLVKIGDKVTNTANMDDCGEVYLVSNSDYEHVGINTESGEKVTTKLDGMKSMVITIRAKATKTAYGYSVNGYDIIIGEDISVRVPDYTGIGKCTSVTELGK